MNQILWLAALLAPAQDEYDPEIVPSEFVAGIDNPYLPLVPGTTFVYEAETEDGFARNEVTVLRKKKTILGVKCTVVRDREYLDGELLEETEDWYAQHQDGTVWYFGERSFDFEDGVPSLSPGSWEAGVDGAKPGIIMLGDPQSGDSYLQEFYEGFAEDEAAVLRLNASVSVEYGDFQECLVTKEWTRLEPGAVEKKYYAAGVGLVLVEEISGGKTVRVELVEVLTD